MIVGLRVRCERNSKLGDVDTEVIRSAVMRVWWVGALTGVSLIPSGGRKLLPRVAAGALTVGNTEVIAAAAYEH
jgi:hypothetical protein